MNDRALRWLTVLAPAACIVLLDSVRMVLSPAVVAPWTGIVLELAVVLLGALLFSRFVFGVVERERERAERQARLKREAQIVAGAEEQDRLARDMHDGVAQVLGYMNVKTQVVEQLLESGQHEQAAVHIRQIGEAARAAYADVQETILGLQNPPTPEHHLEEVLRRFVTAWKEQSGVETDLEFGPLCGLQEIDRELAEAQLVHIVQEALSNVRKHAQARVVRIHAAEHDGWTEVRVVDDGIGFDPAHVEPSQFPRFGLAMMRERASAVGGLLQIESSPGHGTCVLARVPTSIEGSHVACAS